MEAGSPSPRFRFSIRQLATLALFVGMSIALAMQYRELARVRPELRQLRKEAGYLLVDNPAKFYAVEVPKFEKHTWSWKIHVPTSGKYMLYVKVNDLPVEPFGEIPNLPRTPDVMASFDVGGYAFPLDPGEQVLTVNLHEVEGDKIGIQIAAGGGSMYSNFPVAANQWPLHGRPSHRTRVAAVEGIAPKDKPLVLLHLSGPNDARTVDLRSDSPKVALDGIKVWIEAVAR